MILVSFGLLKNSPSKTKCLQLKSSNFRSYNKFLLFLFQDSNIEGSPRHSLGSNNSSSLSSPPSPAARLGGGTAAAAEGAAPPSSSSSS